MNALRMNLIYFIHFIRTGLKGLSNFRLGLAWNLKFSQIFYSFLFVENGQETSIEIFPEKEFYLFC